MTRAGADALRERRAAEHPEFAWVTQRRDGDDWVVMRLPGGARIDPASLDAHKGEPLEVGDDPRLPLIRIAPPYGPAS